MKYHILIRNYISKQLQKRDKIYHSDFARASSTENLHRPGARKRLLRNVVNSTGTNKMYWNGSFGKESAIRSPSSYYYTPQNMATTAAVAPRQVGSLVMCSIYLHKWPNQ